MRKEVVNKKCSLNKKVVFVLLSIVLLFVIFIFLFVEVFNDKNLKVERNMESFLMGNSSKAIIGLSGIVVAENSEKLEKILSANCKSVDYDNISKYILKCTMEYKASQENSPNIIDAYVVYMNVDNNEFKFRFFANKHDIEYIRTQIGWGKKTSTLDCETEETEQEISKKEIYKYDINDINYRELGNSIYNFNSTNNNLIFYDIGLLQNGKKNKICSLTLNFNGEEFYNREQQLSCTYMYDIINDDEFEIEYNYRKKYGEGNYLYGQMTIDAHYENNGGIIVFEFEDETKTTAKNSYYQSFINSQLDEVLYDASLGRFYSLDGTPIYSECENVEFCNTSIYSGINPNDYKIIEYVDDKEQKIYPDIIYLDNMLYSGGSYDLTFYSNYTCKANTYPPSFYSQHYFEDCNYEINKNGDDYLINVSLSYYWNIDHDLEHYTIPFVGKVKDGKIVMLETNFADAIIVFQDYKNYEGKIRMLLKK